MQRPPFAALVVASRRAHSWGSVRTDELASAIAVIAEMMQKLDAKRGSWGNPDALLPTGRGGKVQAGVKALATARDSLEKLKIKLRAAVIPAGAPQRQRPQGLGPGGGPSLAVAALTASLANVQATMKQVAEQQTAAEQQRAEQ